MPAWPSAMTRTGIAAEVYAAIGRRTAVIAEEWHKPIEEWRYEDAARVVQLVNPAWPVLPRVHGAERGRVPAHDRAGLRPVPRARRRPAGLADGATTGALALRPATREAMIDPAGPDQQRARLGARLGAAGGRVRPDALAMGRQQRVPQLRRGRSVQRPGHRGAHQQRQRSAGLRARHRGAHRARPPGVSPRLSRRHRQTGRTRAVQERGGQPS